MDAWPFPNLQKASKKKRCALLGRDASVPQVCGRFFVSLPALRHPERMLPTMKKTYVLIQAPYTVIYAVIFPYVWPPTKWQQSAHAPPMTGEGKHGILVV